MHDKSPGVCEVVETIRATLNAQLRRSNLGAESLVENLTPENDEYADDPVVYEAVIEPHSLDQTRLELWVTGAANLAVGIEKRGRIAERMGVRTGSSVQFITGHEPISVPLAVLEKLVVAIAGGALTIRARHAFGRLLSATARVSASENDMKDFRAYTKTLGKIGTNVPLGRGVSLPYRPW